MQRRIPILGTIVAGCVLLGAISFLLMERHWDHVTRRLAESTARELAAIVDLYEASSRDEDIARLIEISLSRFNLAVAVLPPGPLPVPQPKPFFDLLDRALGDEIRASVGRPFWIDTVGLSGQLEVRIKLERATLRFVAPRGRAYASSSHIFLIWMMGTSAIVLALSYLAMRPALRAS